MSAAINLTVEEVKASEFNCTGIRRRFPELDLLEERALDDCLELLDDTVSELENALSDLSSKTAAKNENDMQTLLSGAMTNQYTCLDGFAFSKEKIRPYIEGRLVNISRHVSNTLAMLNKIRKTTSFEGEAFPDYGKMKGGFPRWLSRRDRRLLQAAVEDIEPDVVVAKDGSGNFTTVGAAVAAAKNSSAARFVIYIKEGAYFEYVEVDKKKTNLMLVGDGIGRTWIKGNRSVVDGWTTFRSSTVVKKDSKKAAMLRSPKVLPNLLPIAPKR
ncbi:plant invertase/pectin methylesterase inhibitor superfamily [Actinidia rufa]|uniref:Plant invertase/pectin methylesterase inhibitor superfamily n=1 Tax=Actinidia rufa TaxID=165716 RepID=A0A7J0H9E4_9ERIC|nr:plant invertase/pectin methylesterase inhibitor superfamily [Actinidia rufa]